MTEKQVITMDLSFEKYLDSVEFERDEGALMEIVQRAYEAGYRAGQTGA